MLVSRRVLIDSRRRCGVEYRGLISLTSKSSLLSARVPLIVPPSICVHTHFRRTMASLQDTIARLEKLSIKPQATVSHTASTSPASWKENLQASTSADVPKEFEYTKTLVFKPKTAKNVTPVPVIVIAREETETSSGALGKKLNLKDLRLAPEDLLKEFFSVDKDSSQSCIALV